MWFKNWSYSGGIGIVIFLLAMYSSQIHASDPTQLMRAKFLEAEKLVNNPDSRAYQKLYNELYFYPLRPYLDQKRLLNQLSVSKVSEIYQFLTTYQGTPLDWPLRKAWLVYLAEQNNAVLFLKFYQTTSNTELQCYRYRFQLQTGVPAQLILPKVTKLWTVGHSQPKACDPLFDQWQQAGYRTTHVILQRIEKAADGGKHTLIPYLTKLLPENLQYIGELWHKVRRNPAIVGRLNQFSGQTEELLAIFSYGIKRLIWRQPDYALRVYQKALKKLQLTATQQLDISRQFAKALAAKHHEKAAEWVAKLPLTEQADEFFQWLIAYHIKQENWQQFRLALENLPHKAQQSSQWLYWYARTLQQSDKLADQQQAITVLKKLAVKRHYYGFLAASQLKQPYQLNHQSIEQTAQEKQHLLENPAAKRAFEWFHLKRYREARSEWNYWTKTLNDRAKLIAAQLAYEAKWYDRPIFTLANVGFLEDTELRFPLAFESLIKQQAQQAQIDPAWAFAIARRESSFMVDATSPAGARGLMQIMPATARHILRKHISRRYLFDAKYNVALGTQYLRYLYKKMNNNWLLATASYNAGPNKVKQWLPDTAIDADRWIELIPYQETRDYVKSVLAYQQIYRHKLNNTNNVFDQVIKMKIHRE